MALPKDPFRRNYGTLKDEQKALTDRVKANCEYVWIELMDVEKLMGPSQDLSLARTKLQEACMWAVRACTRTGDQE